MKIIISLVNGLSLGLYMQNCEPTVYPVSEENGYAIVGFTGLCIHLGFIQIQMGKIILPEE